MCSEQVLPRLELTNFRGGMVLESLLINFGIKAYEFQVESHFGSMWEIVLVQLGGMTHDSSLI